jgi:hypothetical protein
VRAFSREMSRAIRTRELPGLIDPERWLRSLERRRSVLRQLQGVGGVVLTLCALAQLLTLVTGGGSVVLRLVLAAIFLGLAVCAAVVPVRQLPRIDALEEKIRATYGVG